MRAGPQLEIGVVRFGVWRAGTLALAAFVWAALAAWWWAHPAPVPAWVGAVAGFGMFGAAAAALQLRSVRPFVLCRNAAQWQLSFVDDARTPAMPGELQVAIDLGAWLLLRFIPDAAGVRASWLAVQRLGLEPQWHALRCAIHAPLAKQPAAGATVDG